jgi:hypothetical protein
MSGKCDNEFAGWSPARRFLPGLVAGDLAAVIVDDCGTGYAPRPGTMAAVRAAISPGTGMRRG